MSLPRFSVTNPVPVNLMMTAILVAGLVAGLSLRREFFPETEPDAARITLPYPGASPEEVEETLARKVEDALVDLDEVKKITTNLAEGGGGIVVEFREGIADVRKAVDEVERAVDSLIDLPEDAERMTVAEMEPRLPVVMVTIYGETDEESLKSAIRAIRDDLRTLPQMGEALISGVRDYEVRVDVDAQALLEQGISLPQVADAIRSWLADVPGGAVRSGSGNFAVRTLGVPERAEAIREIVIRGGIAGDALRVGDIAHVRETFVDELVLTRFNGKPSASLTVFKVGDQDIVQMAEMVRAYVAGRRGEPMKGSFLDRNPNMPTPVSHAHELGAKTLYPLPPGVQIALHSDLARFVEGRLELLMRNAMQGAVLVFATLLIFLNWRGALWVGVGLVTALAGTMILMQVLDITLNLLTMFGLIIVIGLLVDDAIVVAENIQARHDRGDGSMSAAIKGAEQVSWPVVATVMTTVVAFLPLTFIRGRIGDLLGALPLVVAVALLMSLLESLVILPSHLAHSLEKRDRGRPNRVTRWIGVFERKRDHLIFDRIVPAYGKLVSLSVHFRYVSVSAALALLVISAGLVAGKIVGYEFLPGSDAETLVVDVRMPVGTAIQRTDALVKRIEGAITAQPEVQSLSTVVGQRSDLETGASAGESTHVSQMFIELQPVQDRKRSSDMILEGIRKELRGKIDEAERVQFSEISGGPAGADISLELRGNDEAAMHTLVQRVKDELSRFDGVYDVADDSSYGQRELQIRLKPGAAAIGFTVSDVARQVRGALFGIDAHVFSERQEDIDVRVRLGEATRQSLHAIENLWLISPLGRAVPLTEVAELEDALGYSTIKRIDRERAVTVTADTSPQVSPNDIVAALPVEQWRAEFPTLSIDFSGVQEQQADAFASLPYGFGAAMIMIYVILAWLFSSYTQPIAVMLAIPFGLIGVIWGHFILGFELTFLSMIGFVALSGIIVNDSLILVEFYNERRRAGDSVDDALVAAGKQRLRPIFLTTITTVLGLTPLMLEQSFQARFLIPMAIAIAFGLLSGTMIILLVLPCVLKIVDDIKRTAYFLWHGTVRPEHGASGETVADVVTE